MTAPLPWSGPPEPNRDPFGAAASVFFYVVANTDAWIAAPQNAHNLAGWIQAQTAVFARFSRSTGLRALRDLPEGP